jgi:hypothetical protein
MVQLIGVFDAAPKTAPKPIDGRREALTGRSAVRALPKLTPIKTKGINSPPLNPDPRVIVVKNDFKIGKLK